LFSRREIGAHGGQQLPFLSLPDLIRSKETERAKDWDDVFYLEEFLDARLVLGAAPARSALLPHCPNFAAGAGSIRI